MLKLYENGTLGYLKPKSSKFKALISPQNIRSLALDGKDKLKISTKEKNYLFKFSSSEATKEWHDIIKKSLT